MKSADQLRPGTAARPQERALRPRLQRDQGHGRRKERQAHSRADRGGQVLDAAQLGPVWQDAARDLSAAKKLSLAENARLYALLNMGIANTFIIDWDAKFTYNFWRPVTAIRNGDQDGNDATERDAGWTSLNATPMHPEYPSQATIIAGVSMGILESVFGANPTPVVVSDVADPKIQRRYARHPAAG